MRYQATIKAIRAADPKPRKYRNVPTVVDGVKYDSKAEARRHAELKLLVRTGDITHLRHQPEYPLVVNGFPLGKYIGDFAYFDREGRAVIEDVKSPATAKNPVYVLKRKLVYALHGIAIREVK